MPKVDLVIHLASRSNVRESWINPTDYINSNLIGTINVLEYCKLNEVKLILFSSYLYKGKKNIKSKELDKTYTFNPYALTKKNSEEWCNFYSQNYNLDICILRLFNIYGKKQKTKFYIPSIISKLKRNQKILINKSIYRDYLYIDDLNELVSNIIKNYKKIIGFKIYNVGYGKAFNLYKIACLLKKYINSSSSIKSINDIDKNQIVYTKANIIKISKTFKWKPKINLNKGLKKL